MTSAEAADRIVSGQISDCPRCHGGGMMSLGRGKGGAFCPDCLGTGQRHTVADCCECSGPFLVPWSVDHTLAPIMCASCAAVVNRNETARVTGERGR